jgi:hypothetical protein
VYILVYTDNLLIVAEEPKKYTDIIKSKYFVKPESLCMQDILGHNFIIKFFNIFLEYIKCIV